MIAIRARARAFPPLGLAPLLAIAIGLIGAGHSLAIAIRPGPFEWGVAIYKYSLFLISYQDLGFVKRGLVGSLMNLENDLESRQLITLFSFVVALALATGLCWLMKRQDSPMAQLLFLLSPVMFLQIGFDIGRLDQVNYLILIVGILMAPRFFIFLAPMMLMIHEAALLIFLPMMFGLYIHRYGYDMGLAAASALVVSALIAILLWGGYDGAAPLSTIYPIEGNAIGLLNERVMDVIQKSAGYFWSRPVIRSVFLVESILLVGLVLWLLHLRSPIEGGRAAVLLCCCAPLALHAVGIDWARWTGLAGFNLLLAELVMDRWGLTSPRQPSPSVGRIGDAVAVAQVLLGPAGIGPMFPFLLLIRRTIVDH